MRPSPSQPIATTSSASNNTQTPPTSSTQDPSSRQTSPDTTRRDTFESVLSERKARLEAKRKADAAAESAARAERTEAAKAATARLPEKELKARQEVENRKRAEKAHLELVKARIEMDKVERRARRETERATLGLGGEQVVTTDADAELVPIPQQQIPVPQQQPRSGDQNGSSRTKSKTAPTTTTLRIRTPDGILQTTLPSNAPLAQLHAYIEAETGTIRYTLKQIRTPQPLQTLTGADVDTPLSELDLVPSATLVLIPGPSKYAPAYAAAAAGGAVPGASFVWRVWEFIIGIIMGVYNAVVTLLGLNRAPASVRSASGPVGAAPSTGSGSASTTAVAGKEKEGIRIRTLRDQREGEKDERQLYNGNQLNFEPNKDEEE